MNVLEWETQPNGESKPNESNERTNEHGTTERLNEMTRILRSPRLDFLASPLPLLLATADTLSPESERERVRERCAQPPWRGILCILFAPSAGCLALLPAGLHCYTPFRVSEIALASTLALSLHSLSSLPSCWTSLSQFLVGVRARGVALIYKHLWRVMHERDIPYTYMYMYMWVIPTICTYVYSNMQSRLSTICFTPKLNKSHFHLKRTSKALSIFTQKLRRIGFEFVVNQG